MALTREVLFESIKSTLGGSDVDVELGDRDLERGSNAASQLLARFFPQRGHHVIGVASTVSKYLIDVANIVGVLDVVPFETAGRLEHFPYATSYIDRTLEQGHMEDRSQVFQDFPEWHWQFEAEEVEISPSETEVQNRAYLYINLSESTFTDVFLRRPTHVDVLFAWYIEPSDDKYVGLPRLPFDQEEWFVDYATARCREILGDKRNKFGGIPGPDGQTFQIDGDGQIQRARDDMRRLREDLQARARQLPFLYD